MTLFLFPAKMKTIFIFKYGEKMSRNSLNLFVVALAIALLVACSPSVTDAGRPSVVASTGIVGDVVAQVAGDHVDLTTLIDPGSDPHSFEPSPADLSTMEEAQLIILNGFGLEESLVELVEGLDDPGKVVAASENVNALEGGHEHHHDEDADHDDHDEDGDHDHEEDADHHEEDEDHDEDADHEHEEGEDHEHEEGEDHEEGEHEHEGFDPHVWMNPLNVIVWTQNIASALAEVDPDNAADYEANAASYVAELQALDTWAQERISTISA
ncbi:MAG: metal ABC transporter substrate-binding protein, partial [Chlorobiales bacterium]|nr:metal ABC transporter substrate-binding protein [Chlorobiales bacterium]